MAGTHVAALFRVVIELFGFEQSIFITDQAMIFSYHFALPSFLEDDQPLYVGRDFFGIKRVVYEPASNMRKFLHGDTLHGLESLDPGLIGKPISYYHET